MSSPEIQAQSERWTKKHRRVAKRQGWDMFDYDGNGYLQLQRIDERAVFRSDNEAIAFVERKKAEGCPTAALALELDAFFVTHIYGRSAA